MLELLKAVAMGLIVSLLTAVWRGLERREIASG